MSKPSPRSSNPEIGSEIRRSGRMEGGSMPFRHNNLAASLSHFAFVTFTSAYPTLAISIASFLLSNPYKERWPYLVTIIHLPHTAVLCKFLHVQLSWTPGCGDPSSCISWTFAAAACLPSWAKCASAASCISGSGRGGHHDAHRGLLLRLHVRPLLASALHFHSWQQASAFVLYLRL